MASHRLAWAIATSHSPSAPRQRVSLSSAPATSLRRLSDWKNYQPSTTTLSRRPTPQESQRLAAHVAQHTSDPRKAYGDILWALMQSSEFALNH